MRTTRQCVSWGVAIVGAVAASGVMAETSPFYLGASETYLHDTNLYRAALGTPYTADSQWSTALLAGVNQPFGRSRFYADLTAADNRYVSQTQLDNVSYGLSTGLDWESVNHLSGKLNYTGSRSLTPFGYDILPPVTTKNYLTQQDVSATLNYGFASLLSLQAIVKHDQATYTSTAYDTLDLYQNSASLGLVYKPSGLLSTGIAERYTSGKFPYSVPPGPPPTPPATGPTSVVDDFHRNDIDLTAEWIPSGLSTVDARLSYTKETHNEVTARNFSGFTGSLSWVYKPTSKITTTTLLSRDTGAETAFLTVASSSGAGAVSLISNSVSLQAAYDLTAKVALNATALYVRRDLVGTFSSTPGVADDGYDKFGSLKLGASYKPARNWLIGCSGGREKRGSHSDVSYSYDDDSVTCIVQFKPE